MEEKEIVSSGFLSRWFYLPFCIFFLFFGIIVFGGQFEEAGFLTIILVLPIILLSFLFGAYSLKVIPTNKFGDFSLIISLITILIGLIPSLIFNSLSDSAGWSLAFGTAILVIAGGIISFILIIISFFISLKSK